MGKVMFSPCLSVHREGATPGLWSQVLSPDEAWSLVPGHFPGEGSNFSSHVLSWGRGYTSQVLGQRYAPPPKRTRIVVPLPPPQDQDRGTTQTGDAMDRIRCGWYAILQSRRTTFLLSCYQYRSTVHNLYWIQKLRWWCIVTGGVGGHK